MNTGCIILAGGKGLRLGQDKVLETVGNRSLLEQVISCVSPICNEVTIVTAIRRDIPQNASHHVRVVSDIFPGKGPLGGIYTGLKVSGSFHNLVVACDMPFLNQGLLKYMVQLAADFDLVVPRVGKLVEPLHAVYSKNCLAPIENMLGQDRLSVNKLISQVKVRYVEAEEIDNFDPEHLSFFNINTRADLKIAREIAGRDWQQ